MGKTLALPLRTAVDHGELLHEGVRHGTVVIWQQRCRQQWKKVEPEDDLPRAMSLQVGREDRYFSPNEFHGWRLVKLLRSLRAAYVDIDGCRDWPMVLDAIQGMHLPEPSLVVESGRGLHLYWTLEPMPAQTLPVWQAVQDALVKKLAAVGADPSARDCTRVLRIVGSIHGQTQEIVRGWLITPRRWTMHELADEVLGNRKTRAPGVVIGMPGARAKREASTHQRTGPYRLWHDRYQDLCKIAEHHAFLRPQGVAEGNRDRLLFLLSNALSWFTRSQSLADEVQRVAKTYMPSLSAREVTTYTQPILARALAAQRGELVDFQGQKRDPRYWFHTETLRTWLQPLLTPELEARLKVLGAPKPEAERKAIRKAQKATLESKRVRPGRSKQTRAEYLRSAQERRDLVLKLQTEGMNLTAIAKQLGITRPAVSLIVKRANAPRKSPPVLV